MNTRAVIAFAGLLAVASVSPAAEGAACIASDPVVANLVRAEVETAISKGGEDRDPPTRATATVDVQVDSAGAVSATRPDDGPYAATVALAAAASTYRPATRNCVPTSGTLQVSVPILAGPLRFNVDRRDDVRGMQITVRGHATGTHVLTTVRSAFVLVASGTDDAAARAALRTKVEAFERALVTAGVVQGAIELEGPWPQQPIDDLPTLKTVVTVTAPQQLVTSPSFAHALASMPRQVTSSFELAKKEVVSYGDDSAALFRAALHDAVVRSDPVSAAAHVRALRLDRVQVTSQSFDDSTSRWYVDLPAIPWPTRVPLDAQVTATFEVVKP